MQTHKDTKIKLKKENSSCFSVFVFSFIHTFAANFVDYTLLYIKKEWIN